MTTPRKIDGVDQQPMKDEEFVWLYGTGAISENDVVAIHTGATVPTGFSVQHCVRKADSANQDGKGCVVGRADETITTAGLIRVQVLGVGNVNVAATVAAGDRLVASSTAGRAQEATQLNGSAAADFDYACLGVALGAASSNVASCRLTDPMKLA